MTTPGSDQPPYGEGQPAYGAGNYGDSGSGSMPPPPSYDPGTGYPGAGGGGVVAPKNGFGIAALVLGIIALVTCWTAVGGIVLGILAIIFAILGIRRANQGVSTNKGMSIAGLVTGIIGLIIGILFAAFIGSVFSIFGSQIHDYQNCVQQANGDQAQIQQCANQFNQQLNNKTGN